MNTTHTIAAAALLNTLVPAHAEDLKDGRGDTPSLLEIALQEHERVTKEREEERRIGFAPERARKLGKLSAANTVENRAELMKWFKSLPMGEPSSDPRQAEKIAVMKALAKMMPPVEFKEFGLGVLDMEISALRWAQLWSQENYYPRGGANVTLDALVRDMPDADVINKLAAYAKDKSIAKDVRSRIKAFLVNWQLKRDGITDAAEMAKLIVGNLTNPPRQPVPWNIYRDKDKRIAYGKSEEALKASKISVAWLSSEAVVENNANERALDALGMAAVAQLIRAAEEDGHTGEKRDYLVYLATDIFWKHAERGNNTIDEASTCLDRLNRLFDPMPDRGVFCWRSLTAGNLNKLYARFGIDTRVEAETGRHAETKEENPVTP